jgi:hypothetical protein
MEGKSHKPGGAATPARQACGVRCCWLVCAVACSTTPSVPPGAELFVEPLPPSSGEPPRPAPPPAQRGHILAARHRDGHHDLGLLARVEGSRVVAAAAERCEVVRQGTSFERLLASRSLEPISVEEVFSNEANTCLGHVTARLAADFVAVRGLETEPGELRSFSRDVTHDIAADARAQVLLAAAADAAKLGSVEQSLHGFAVGGQLWAVTTVVASAARFSSCAPVLPAVTGVAVYRVTGSTFERVLVHAVPSAGDVTGGAWSFVDFVMLRGADEPLIVLARDECECWSFALAAPVDGRWRLAVEDGGGGCTI